MGNGSFDSYGDINQRRKLEQETHEYLYRKKNVYFYLENYWCVCATIFKMCLRSRVLGDSLITKTMMLWLSL